jgi:TIR domain
VAGADILNVEREKAYQAVFVSYSSEDTLIVDQLQHAYTVLGMSYVRDIEKLRSGQDWNDIILAAIPSADIFQLCWSHAAKRSRFVEREWRCALALNRQHFIRPVLWEMPMPSPPDDLAHLHFARLPLRGNTV